jgi:hypothetical protein
MMPPIVKTSALTTIARLAKHARILGGSLAALLCVNSAHAEGPGRINVCFKTAASTNYSGAAVIGDAKDMWNKIVFNVDSTAAALVDSAGGATSVTLDRKLSGGNVWGAPWAAPLMGEFTYMGGPITLKNLKPGMYDIFLCGFRGTSYKVNGLTSPPCADSSSPYVADRFINNGTYTVLHPVVEANGEMTIASGGAGETVMFGFQVRPAVANLPPTAANPAVTILKHATHTFTVTEFSFADADIWDSFQKLKVTALPLAGTLKLNDSEVTLDQEIAVADLAAGNLKFTPAPGMSGARCATFQFRVTDGTSYSSEASTATVNVIDTFGLIDVCFKTAASANYTGAAAVGGEGDVWNKIPLGSRAVGVPLVDQAGAATGVAFHQGGVYSFNAWGAPSKPPSLLGEFTFSPGTVTLSNLAPGNYDVFLYGWNGAFFNSNGESSAQLNARFPSEIKLNDSYSVLHPVVDGSGKLMIAIGGGGEPVFCGLQIRPAAPNRPPTSANQTVTLLKNAVHTFTLAEFKFADADDGNTFQKLKVTAMPRAGTLKLSGFDVAEISVADLAAGELKFTPAPGKTGAPYTTFQFRVSDGTSFGNESSYSSETYTATVNVIDTFGLINVCFKAQASANYTGAAAAGGAADVWNKIPLGSPAAGVPLADQAGAATGVTLDQGGIYPSNALGSPPNPHPLLGEFTNSKGTVTLNNLAPGNYDLYLYGWKNVEFKANGKVGPKLDAEIPTEFTLDKSYAVLHPVVDGGGKLTIAIGGGDTPVFCGFQLRQVVPENPPAAPGKTVTVDKDEAVGSPEAPPGQGQQSAENGRPKSWYWISAGFLIAAVILFLRWRAKKTGRNDE